MRGKVRVEEKRRATAYHEAGHAVADILLGFMVNRVTIVPQDDSLGQAVGPDAIYGYWGETRERKSRARDAIVALYAGLAAEHICLGTPFSFDEGAEHGAWGDHDQAWDLLRNHALPRGCSYVGDEVFWRGLRRLQLDAVRLVRRHRGAIERVAVALLERGTLWGTEVKALIDQT